MKIFLSGLVVLLAGVLVCPAQDDFPTPAPFNANRYVRQLALQNNQTSSVQNGVPSGPIAEAITPEIQALADGLEDDPVKIFNYVHDHIQHVLYFGSKKGAQLTLLEKSGNDFDQCALLVSLLNAAGYDGTAYEFGWMEMPYDSSNHQDLHHWLQLNLNNTNWSYTTNYLENLVYSVRGFPAVAAIWDTNTYAFQRVWVSVYINGTFYNLDPAFKVYEPVAGINLTNAMNFSSNSLLTAAGGTDGGYYSQSLNEAAVRSSLTTCTSTLLSNLQASYPNASVQDILGGWQLAPANATNLSTSLAFPVYEWGGQMPVIEWDYLPTNLMSTFAVSVGGASNQWYLPQLGGQRLTLLFDSNEVASLWLEDTQIFSQSTGQTNANVNIQIKHPVGYWNTTNNSFVDTGAYDDNITKSYYSVNASYALMYSFEPDWGWLQKRQDRLDAYKQQGLADTSRQVLSETLNIMGLTWSLQCEATRQMLATELGTLHQTYHRFGRMGQAVNYGYFFDVYDEAFGDCSSFGDDAANHDLELRDIFLSAYFESALEHGVIEELQTNNLQAVSTVKVLQFANTNGETIYLANSNHWTAIRSALSGYPTTTLTNFDAHIAAGETFLLPQYGTNQIGGWNGTGFMEHPASPSATNYWEAYYFWATWITGAFGGGWAENPSARVNPFLVARYGHSQPRYSPFVRRVSAADPVDIARGTFQVDRNDIAIGENATEPYGITYRRYYNSALRYNDSVQVGPGWVDNYVFLANQMTAPEACLGKTTPAQAASMLVATCAAAKIYSESNATAKNWTTTALIAKWGIDQVINSGVSVTMGKDTLQFVKQPTGVYTPPGNCTFTLTQSNSAYKLQERHGRTFNFLSAGWITNIVDQYGQTMRIYTGGPETNQYIADPNPAFSTAWDWNGRSIRRLWDIYYLNLITRVISSNQTVWYTYDSQSNLSTCKDQDGNTNATYLYDTNHQIVAVLDAQNRLVVSNVYDTQGHVTTQYSQGDTSKAWHIFWSGYENVEEDPAGNKRRFYFDDKSRLTGLRDALGNLTQYVYDGQDRVAAIVSPMNETNRFIYDGNNNLVETIDPLGYSNVFTFDANNNLIASTDARGNTNHFGYNAKFQLTAQTNGAGDAVTNTYDSTTGLLTARADAGGTTSFGYDSLNQLSSITYPNGLGSEGFQNSADGDVITHTNARGVATSSQYNNRRLLTNTTAPTNLSVIIAYDGNANVLTMRDALGFTSTNAWSSTRKLQGTAFPVVAQGVPVMSNAFDSRDLLARSLNPLQQAVRYSNDPAGRLIAVADPLSRTNTFGYDNDGRRVTATNAALEASFQQLNARGEVLASTDPATNTVKTAFDGAGNQTVLTNRNGKLWQFQFDAANRLTNTLSPLNRQTHQVWNHLGRLQSFTDPMQQTTSFGYDARGRLTSRNDSVGNTSFVLDANGNLATNAENGQSLVRAFDAYDRVYSYTDSAGNVIQYGYDNNHNLTGLTYPGNRTVHYYYDSLNRLTNVTDWASRQTVFAYDLAGRLTSIVRQNGTVCSNFYDAAGEVTNIVEQAASRAPIAFFKLNYNNAARVQWEFAGPLPQPYTLPTRANTFDDDNRLATVNGTSVSNDLDGNLTYGPLPAGTFGSYTYDARNRLTSASGLNFGYDPGNNRVAVTNGASVTRFVVDPNAALPQVLMRIKPGGVTNYYVYGGGLLYEVDETATTTNALYYHFDLRGSTVALTDGSGNVTDHMEYSAYGSTTFRLGTNDTPFLFNGRHGVQTDANGLLYMRARYYNPYLCRFINADPSGFAGGLNLYAFASGNPVSLNDPTGLDADPSDPFSWVVRGGDPMDAWSGPISMVDYSEMFGIGGDVARAVVPGYAAWGASSDAWQNDQYGLAAAYGFQALGEEALFALSLGTSEEINFGLNAADSKTLFHYTSEKGLAGILDSQEINPSLKALNPKDARYGNGQYLTDIAPGTRSPASVARELIGIPNKYKFTHYVEIDVTGLKVVEGRPGVFVIPNEAPLDIKGRVVSSGAH